MNFTFAYRGKILWIGKEMRYFIAIVSIAGFPFHFICLRMIGIN